MTFLKRWILMTTFLVTIGAALGQAAQTEVGVLALTNTSPGAGAAVLDSEDGLAYFGSTVAYTVPPSGIKFVNDDAVELNTFTFATGISIDSGPVTIDAAVFDPIGKRIYVGGKPGLISNAVSFSVPIGISPVVYSTLTLPSPLGTQPLTSAVFDSKRGHILFGTNASPAQIIQVSSETFTYISSITLSVDYLTAAAIDPNGDFAYFGSSTVPGALTKIQLSNFSVVQTVTFASGEGAVAAIIIDTTTNAAYIGTHDNPAKIIRVNLSTFQETGRLILLPGENNTGSAVTDGIYGYFGTTTSPGRVVRVNLQALSEQAGGGLILSAGQNNLKSALIDTVEQYAYYKTDTYPSSMIIKLDLLGGAPEITLQPANAGVQVGGSASFAVGARGRNLTYQWQKDGVTIPGATSPVYTGTDFTLDDDGESFHCVVSNSLGTVISQSATLTVTPVVRVYPDPWRIDRFAGVPITFDGLPAGAVVKIFTVSAHLVKTLNSSSGVAKWDRTNEDGQQVATGYYYYAVESSDSKQSVQGKLAIIK